MIERIEAERDIMIE